MRRDFQSRIKIMSLFAIGCISFERFLLSCCCFLSEVQSNEWISSSNHLFEFPSKRRVMTQHLHFFYLIFFLLKSVFLIKCLSWAPLVFLASRSSTRLPRVQGVSSFFCFFLSLPGIYTIIVHLAQLSDGEIAFWGLDEDGYSGSFTSFSSLQSYQGESPLSKT